MWEFIRVPNKSSCVQFFIRSCASLILCDGHHVRLDNHSATTLQVWHRPITGYVPTCHQRGRSRNCYHGYRRNVKEHTIGEKIPQIRTCQSFCWGASQTPHCCSLITSHYKTRSSFTMSIFRPDAGNLMVTTNLCQSQSEFLYSDPSIIIKIIIKHNRNDVSLVSEQLD